MALFDGKKVYKIIHLLTFDGFRVPFLDGSQAAAGVGVYDLGQQAGVTPFNAENSIGCTPKKSCK